MPTCKRYKHSCRTHENPKTKKTLQHILLPEKSLRSILVFSTTSTCAFQHFHFLFPQIRWNMQRPCFGVVWYKGENFSSYVKFGFSSKTRNSQSYRSFRKFVLTISHQWTRSFNIEKRDISKTRSNKFLTNSFETQVRQWSFLMSFVICPYCVCNL